MAGRAEIERVNRAANGESDKSNYPPRRYAVVIRYSFGDDIGDGDRGACDVHASWRNIRAI